ncbi:hypothetical protein F511_41201 [Dorcoceras hygrometricum]|uniref:Uncharacterized protein n=1 Tax=Dorcoceras hygrometricum TaxID=472368 RepID=A0A2Z7C5Q9_9LAMI|nr:hypothetical protein F511_41201 [Dorcoceras hygrometricum]
MPPRRGRGRTARRSAEESRGPGGDEDVQQNVPLRRRERQAEVEDVTRHIGEICVEFRVDSLFFDKRCDSSSISDLKIIAGRRWANSVRPGFLLFTEHYFSDLSSISAVVWSKIGGAELVLLSSFDCYQLGDLIRRVGGARIPVVFAKPAKEHIGEGGVCRALVRSVEVESEC